MKTRSSVVDHQTSTFRGFSLLEIMAAMAVLSITVLILVQLTSATSRATFLSNRPVDAASQARLAFDRIGLDLSGLVKRSDVDIYSRDPSNSSANEGYGSDDPNTLLLILSTAASADSSLPTGTKNRSISLLAYQVNSHPNNNTGIGGQVLPCLIHAGKAIPWESSGTTGFMGLGASGLPVRFNTTDVNFVASLLPKAPSGTNPNDYDILAAGVIRMVVGFQLYPDNLPVTLASGTTLSAPAQGQIVYSAPMRTLIGNDGSPATYVDLNRISAIVVGLVSVDTNSLKVLNAMNVNSIAAQFPVPPTNKLPVQAWTGIANGLVSSTSGNVPKSALQAVRVYQRFYPVTPFPFKPL